MAVKKDKTLPVSVIFFIFYGVFTAVKMDTAF